MAYSRLDGNEPFLFGLLDGVAGALAGRNLDGAPSAQDGTRPGGGGPARAQDSADRSGRAHGIHLEAGKHASDHAVERGPVARCAGRVEAGDEQPDSGAGRRRGPAEYSRG